MLEKQTNSLPYCGIGLKDDCFLQNFPGSFLMANDADLLKGCVHKHATLSKEEIQISLAVLPDVDGAGIDSLSAELLVPTAAE